MADKDTRKRFKQKKNHYGPGNKRRRKENSNLVAGIQGVLITCNERKERYAIREAYNLLNEYANEIYGKEVTTAIENDSSSDDDDIEKAIEKEKKQMKCEFQRFQSMKCGAKNVLFIKTELPNDEDPTELVHTILSDMLKNGLNKSRDCMRFLPVSACCYAGIKEIQSTAEELFKDSFLSPDSEPCKFCVVYKARNNDSIHRDDVIAALAQIVLNSGMDHSVDLHHADLTICVEIVRTICCLSVVKDFSKLKKYNIQEIQKHGHNKETVTSREKANEENAGITQKTLENAPKNEENENKDSTEKDCSTDHTTYLDKIGLKDEKSDIETNDTNHNCETTTTTTTTTDSSSIGNTVKDS